jgi:hypothetical protein
LARPRHTLGIVPAKAGTQVPFRERSLFGREPISPHRQHVPEMKP